MERVFFVGSMEVCLNRREKIMWRCIGGNGFVWCDTYGVPCEL